LRWLDSPVEVPAGHPDLSRRFGAAFPDGGALLRTYRGCVGPDQTGPRGPQDKEPSMTDDKITLELGRADAEVLLGVLSSERHNADAEAVCDSIRRQIDEKLAASGQ
jgi:hypothetical protein